MILREVRPSDLPAFYEDQADPLAYELADFPTRDREAFMAHWERILADPAGIVRAVEVDGQLAGHVLSFERDGMREVGYWITRELWGRGIASRALSALLEIETRRPLHARVATHNLGSIRVLEKAGFRPSGELPDGLEFRLG